MWSAEYADNYEEKLRDVIDDKLPKYIQDKFAKEKEPNGDTDDDDRSSISISSFDAGLQPVYKTESPTEKYAPLL